MQPKPVLPFRWSNPDGVAGEEWLSLVNAYKEKAKDALSVAELVAEVKSLADDPTGVVFVCLDRERRLSGYLCAKIQAVTKTVLVTQWFKLNTDIDNARLATDALFGLVRDFAKEQDCDRILMETRAVCSDGRVPRKLLMALDKIGFKPKYVGCEMVI